MAPMNGNNVIKANKKFAGQRCSVCGREINLGDLIHVDALGDYAWHEGCNSAKTGMSSEPQNNSAYQTGYQNNNYQNPNQPNMNRAPQQPGAAYGINGNGNNNNMVPCRWCKEPIIRGARICKHCNQFQNDKDIENAKHGSNGEGGDPTLSTTDWIGVLCCPLIGLIQAGIYANQGQTARAKRLGLYCAIALVIGWVLQIISSLINVGGAR